MKSPDVIIFLTDQERAIPPYEKKKLIKWRDEALVGRCWFEKNGISFNRHYTGSLACVPSRPTLFTGQYPDVHGATQTDGIGKNFSDTRMRWLRPGEVPTLGHWFQAAGYDTHYDGKWHMSHADLVDPLTGDSLATNTDTGEIIDQAVQTYLDADPLKSYGFSGWVGPEPHGSRLANSGLVRDPLTADRTVTWLKNRYLRRKAGEEEALKPFFLVVSFVNPHDIVFFPSWSRDENNPLKPCDLDPPSVPEPPTRYENLQTKPAAQAAYKYAYYSGYGPALRVQSLYENNEQAYRDLYYRLHLEVDSPIDRVRRVVTEGGSDEAILFRTSDHGELLGAHGGLHQKWFTLYDEATRIPFQVVRIGSNPTTKMMVTDIPTSHVDLVPTALALAGFKTQDLEEQLISDFTELHPLPGLDLSPIINGEQEIKNIATRAVYFLTRDNVLEGDTLASVLARRIGRTFSPPLSMKIQVPEHVGSNFEGIVTRVFSEKAIGGVGHLWKLNRVFDDPETWTNPNLKHLSSTGQTGNTYRTNPLFDEWELYDLEADPNETNNLANDSKAADVFRYLKNRMQEESSICVPKRNTPWPYSRRNPPSDKSEVENFS